MENQTGINTEEIRTLCLEINEYSNKIKNILNQLSDTWDDVSPELKNMNLVSIQNKFLGLEDSFEIIYKNINSYIDDFNSLSSKYEMFDIDLSRQVKLNAENVEKEEKYNANNW